MRVTEENYETLKKVSDITMTDYDIKWFDPENIDGYIDTDTLLTMLDDMILEYDAKEEQLEDLRQDIEDNYKPIPHSEQAGISDKDFL